MIQIVTAQDNVNKIATFTSYFYNRRSSLVLCAVCLLRTYWGCFLNNCALSLLRPYWGCFCDLMLTCSGRTEVVFQSVRYYCLDRYRAVL